MNDIIEQKQAANSDRGIVVAQSSRQIAEVQAATIMAKQYPRDETTALTKILGACKRTKLAEVSQYSYPRGNATVSGPSIRLAETIARYWGNLDFGIAELEQRQGESVVMAYCIDLETNTRESKTFTVPHVRHTRGGQYPLTDPRDIYEMVANQGARRLRSCILGIIPGDIVDSAIEECDKTMAGNNNTPLIDRIRTMVVFFQEELQVTQVMIELRLGHKVESSTETELVQLKKIICSLKDNMSKREDWFHVNDLDNKSGSVVSAAIDAMKHDGSGDSPEVKTPESERPTKSSGDSPEPSKPTGSVAQAQDFLDKHHDKAEEIPPTVEEQEAKDALAKATNDDEVSEVEQLLIAQGKVETHIIEEFANERRDKIGGA